MGGRGAAGLSDGLFYRTEKQDRTIKSLVKKTQNLKNEQYRIIDAEGNVLVAGKGTKHEVGVSVGEKRANLRGNISLHNHPEGGPFSDEDLNDFGFGATEMVVAAPEGTYRLINTKVGTRAQYEGWYDMREALRKAIPEADSLSLLKQAQKNMANSKAAKQMRAISEKWDKLRQTKGEEVAKRYLESTKEQYNELQAAHREEVAKERRRLEVKPYDDFYKKNAKKYGFVYRFEKK